MVYGSFKVIFEKKEALLTSTDYNMLQIVIFSRCNGLPNLTSGFFKLHMQQAVRLKARFKIIYAFFVCFHILQWNFKLKIINSWEPCHT